MRIGLFIGDSEKNLRIIKFLSEYFKGNCFVYSFLTAAEIYDVKGMLDVLFLDTAFVSKAEFSKIEDAVSFPLILLYDKEKPRNDSHISIPLLFNNLNYSRAISEAVNKSEGVEKLVCFTKKTEKNFIYLNKIIYIYGVEKELLVYLSNGTVFKASERLKNFYTRVADERFLIIHNDYMINMDFVKTMKDETVLMIGETELPIKAYNRKDIINNFYKYKVKKHKRSSTL